MFTSVVNVYDAKISDVYECTAMIVCSIEIISFSECKVAIKGCVECESGSKCDKCESEKFGSGTSACGGKIWVCHYKMFPMDGFTFHIHIQ